MADKSTFCVTYKIPHQPEKKLRFFSEGDEINPEVLANASKAIFFQEENHREAVIIKIEVGRG